MTNKKNTSPFQPVGIIISRITLPLKGGDERGGHIKLIETFYVDLNNKIKLLPILAVNKINSPILL